MVQPVEQLLAEPPLLDHFEDRYGTGRDEPEPWLGRRHVRPGEANKPRLDLGRRSENVADKERAATWLVAVEKGVEPLLVVGVTEGQDNERGFFARAAVVNQLREPLRNPGLALNQNGAIRRRRALNVALHIRRENNPARAPFLLAGVIDGLHGHLSPST
jgi:hypothetical protein